MRLSALLFALSTLVACERNRTTVVKTTPAPPPPPAEARAEPEPNLEHDLDNNLPEPRPTEPQADERTDDTGVNGDRPAPAVEAGPDEPPVQPPR